MKKSKSYSNIKENAKETSKLKKNMNFEAKLLSNAYKEI